MMFQNRSIDVHQFAMVPKSDVPRSAFKRQFTHKTTFDSGYLVPFMVDEVLPGDHFNCEMTAFARMLTPIYPIMDNLHMDFFFFFVPNRLVWSNFKKFMGEQDNPADSISYTIPQHTCPAGGYAVGSLQDYMGLPTVGQVGGGATYTHSALPLRSYNLIVNTWFRDENLQNSVTVDLGDSGDSVGNYVLKRRGKRHDYFTSCLPWVQKGTAVSLPLSGNATVKPNATALLTGAQNTMKFSEYSAGSAPTSGVNLQIIGGNLASTATGSTASPTYYYANNLYADLSTATSQTINQLRLAFQTQRFLERDARAGTRYTELVRSHFGVISPDARLQRPEYLGGGSTVINVSPIAQTSGTSASGTTTPLGTLSAVGTGLARNIGFNQSFTEHGHIIGIVSVRADLTYQQGLRKMWSRSTRYDHYFPAFAMLGEQAVLNKEIYCDGSANDANTFGYQERWAELRYFPSMVTGKFRSTASGTLDAWHLAQKFTSLPTLNDTFISDTPPVSRVVAVASQPEFYFDSFVSINTVRPLPLFSVPGMIDHF